MDTPDIYESLGTSQEKESERYENDQERKMGIEENSSFSEEENKFNEEVDRLLFAVDDLLAHFRYNVERLGEKVNDLSKLIKK